VQVLAQLFRTCDMVGMTMSDENAAKAARCLGDSIQVLRMVVPGIDDKSSFWTA